MLILPGILIHVVIVDDRILPRAVDVAYCPNPVSVILDGSVLHVLCCPRNCRLEPTPLETIVSLGCHFIMDTIAPDSTRLICTVAKSPDIWTLTRLRLPDV